jgi:hypothetical protein
MCSSHCGFLHGSNSGNFGPHGDSSTCARWSPTNNSPSESIDDEHIQPTKQPVIDKRIRLPPPRLPTESTARHVRPWRPRRGETKTPAGGRYSTAAPLVARGLFSNLLNLLAPVNFAARGAVARGEPPPFELPPGPRHRVPSRTPPRPILFVEAQAWPRSSSARGARAGNQVQAAVREYPRRRW